MSIIQDLNKIENNAKRRFKTSKIAKEYIKANSIKIGNELHVKQGVSVFNDISLKEF